MQSDKAQVEFLISNMPLPAGEVINIEMGASSVWIIDTMCVVNMVNITRDMTNEMHFSKKLVAIVIEISKTNYEEIRIVFY